MPEGAIVTQAQNKTVKATRKSHNDIVVAPNVKEVQSPKGCKRPHSDYEEEDVQNGKQRKRLKWTTELQDKFLKAVNKLGLFHGAVPSAILKEMGPCPGLTRENVASHLQLYRAQVVKEMLNSLDAPTSYAGPIMKSSSTHCRRELIQAKEKEKQVHPGCHHPMAPMHPQSYHPHYHPYASYPPPAYCANNCHPEEHEPIHSNVHHHHHHHHQSESEDRLILDFLEPTYEQWAS